MTCKPSDLKGQRIGNKLANETTTSCQLVQNFLVCAVETSRLHKLKSFGLVGRHSKLYCLCSLDIQNFIVCAVAIFKTLLFVQSRHSKLYCLCSRDIQNFIVCAVATFKTLLFVQSRHSKLYCLCSRDIQNFIVCAVETFKTLLFVQSRHSKLYCLCSRAIRNFLVCVSLLGLRRKAIASAILNLEAWFSSSSSRKIFKKSWVFSPVLEEIPTKSAFVTQRSSVEQGL